MTIPPEIGVVAADLLAALAAEAPGPAAPPPGPPPPAGGYGSRLLVGRWLAARGVGYRVKPDPDAKGRTVYVLAACPFDPGHADPDACVMQAADGRLSAKCFHNACQGRGWAAFKAAVGPPDPDHYDPPLGPRRGRATRNRAPAGGARPGPAGRTGDAAAPADAAAAERDSPPAGPTEDPTAPPDVDPPGPPGGGRPSPPQSGARGEITIDPANVPVADTMAQVTATLLTAGDCYRRAGQPVRVHDGEIAPVLTAGELAGLVNHRAEVVLLGDDSAEFRPLPTAYATTWLNHPGEAARLPPITLFTRHPVYAPDWRVAPPGYDPPSGVYTAGPAVDPRPDTARLDRLLADFCFRTPADRTNYVGVLVTAVLAPHFVGSKPAVLFAGNQPGLGKSVLAQVIAILRDGRPAETATYNPNDEEFEKRLGAIVRRGATTVIVDNAKGRPGRAPRIESACLERSITDPVLSFRLLGQSREIRAENSHIFCLTANAPDVGRDLVTRSVVVELYHEGDPARRAFGLPDPEGYALDHRAELLGEVLGLVDRWLAAGAPRADAASRFNKRGWGPVVGGVLAAAGLPDFLGNAADAAEQLDETRREFAALVGLLLDHEQGQWTAAELADYAASRGLFPEEFGDATPRARATRLGVIAGRFVGEAFRLPDGRVAAFRKGSDRKGSVYSVAWTNPDTDAGG